MKRIVLIAGVLTVTGLVALGAGGEGGDGRYLVRAVFDNAGFLVPGEDVRIAGATVGTVDEVDVTRPDEQIGRGAGGGLGGDQGAGKAVAVLEITDAGFQDFRADASCLIRPQSLLGERYVECLPTRPREPGAPLPPALEQIPDGQAGAGQRLLGLANNGKAVDLDLVTNIMREPEVDRFRLILNELGAGLAARGPELDEIIRRANPALAELDRTLAILASERRRLAQLAGDTEAAIGPLARERQALARFIDSAGETAEVAAIRSDDVEAGIRELPPALRQLRGTAVELAAFAREGEPLARDLNTAAPGIAGALARVPGVSGAATSALTSLGDAGVEAAPDLVAADPIIRDLGRLAASAAPGSQALKDTLESLRAAGGFEYLFDLIYNGSGSFNGFDQYGHFLRAELLVTNCVDYVTKPLSGCGANFSGPAAAAGQGQSTRAASRELLNYLVGKPRGGDGGPKR